MFDLVMICGYRRTGKDILCFNLREKREFRWRIYSKGLELIPDKNYKRFAFADKLKEEVALIYNIPINIADKDKIQFEDKSARDLYIEHGNYRKTTDPDCWCKQLTESNLIVTDWRFINEIDFVKNKFKNVVTARVYRSVVKIPPLNITSEHELDHVLTDFLVVPDDDSEFTFATKHFPQYAGYILSGFL